MEKLLGIMAMALCIVGCGNDPGGVQLWEYGPYWAECNIGATKPEECGHYFWWGDTIGYLHAEDRWFSAENGEIIKFSYSSGTHLDSGIFVRSSIADLTCDKDKEALLSAGYIDSTGNLAPTYDAATAHLGSPWRMPTKKDFLDLERYCTTTWTMRGGVYGRLVIGKGSYRNKSIFLPAAGCTSVRERLPYPYLIELGEKGFYWSSTLYDSDRSRSEARCLYFSKSSDDIFSDCFGMGYKGSHGERYSGRSVRPVRDFVIEKTDKKEVLRHFLRACKFFKYDAADELIDVVDQSNVEVQFYLGLRCLVRENKRPRVDEAVKWFLKAAEQGYAKAQMMLGLMYSGEFRDVMPMMQYQEAAEQGDVQAQMRLAIIKTELWKRGVTKDDREAAKWFRKAAEQGDANAQSWLGYMYFIGRGVTKDDREAAKWFRKAALQGDAVAQCCLGRMYANGLGVTKDDREAVKWYRKAAAQGNEDAKKELKKRGSSE